MLTVNYEFRKGIFFIRLIGNLYNETIKKEGEEIIEIIKENKFKYIVINTNYLKKVDMAGIIYLINLYNITQENKCSLIVCDRLNIIKKLINKNIPSITSELELL